MQWILHWQSPDKAWYISLFSPTLSAKSHSHVQLMANERGSRWDPLFPSIHYFSYTLLGARSWEQLTPKVNHIEPAYTASITREDFTTLAAFLDTETIGKFFGTSLTPLSWNILPKLVNSIHFLKTLWPFPKKINIENVPTSPQKWQNYSIQQALIPCPTVNLWWYAH